MFKKEAKNIIFTYKKDLIFDVISNITSYRARTISSASGGQISENLFISNDDKDTFDISIKSILPDIYEKIMKLSSGVENAYSSDGTDIKIIMSDNAAYNSNVIGMVDATILECITLGCIKEWYKTCAQAEFKKEFDNLYMLEMQKLSDRLFQLKKKQIVSNLGALP